MGKQAFLGLLAMWMIVGIHLNLSEAEASEEIKVQYLLSSADVPPGGSLVLACTFDIPKGYHLFHHAYSYEQDEIIPAYAKLELPSGVSSKQGFYPKYEIEPDEDKTKVYRGKVSVLFIITIAESVEPQAMELNLAYGYQTCNDAEGYCLQPVDETIKVPLRIVALGSSIKTNYEPFRAMVKELENPGAWLEAIGKHESLRTSLTPENKEEAPATGTASLALPMTTQDQAPASPTEQAGLDVAGVLERSGLFKLLLIMFVFGIGTSLTPCVYPMIPITMSFFMSQVKKSRLSVLIMALAYVMGIAVTYSTLGVVVASIGGTFGEYSAHPAVLVPLIIIFILLGLSMLGIIGEIQLPAALSDRMMGETKQGVLGALLMGIFLGFIAAPCVMPIVISLLGFVAQTGNFLLGFWGMFVFAWGMGVLFIILAFFPKMMSSLPTSGMWMETVKHFFAAVIFGVAIYYTGQLVQNSAVMLAIWGIYLLIVAVYLGVGAQLSEEPSHGTRVKRGFGLAFLIIGGALLISALMKLELLPTLGGSQTNSPTKVITWQNYEQGIPDPLALAREERKPVFLDFWATWCLKCKDMDRTTFKDPGVVAAMNGYIPLKIQAESDAAEGNILLKRLIELHKGSTASGAIIGLPTYMIIDSSGAIRWSENKSVKPAEMITKLDQYRVL